ncbi:MAG: hypothetical protein QGH20_10850 [Candidatus Latescibacteria bacterium]|nr:hypothetical protein [Candidatus Latescibacterota bacterium]
MAAWVAFPVLTYNCVNILRFTGSGAGMYQVSIFHIELTLDMNTATVVPSLDSAIPGYVEGSVC